MRLCEIVHGEARDVANWLDTKESAIDMAELQAALVNALNRIAILERQLKQTDSTASHAAHQASCLANGMILD